MKKVNLAEIELLVLDVDGVLTDGTIVLNGDGTESKFFNALDGHGIKLWKRAGLKAAFLSGRKSEPVARRAEQLGVDYCMEGCLDKLPALNELLAKCGVTAEKTAYIGDDLPDLPVIREVGFGVAVANAVGEVRQEADYVTKQKGGDGAVREVIEYILKKGGRWEDIMKRYLA
jgi:3-deoxy-D-manno-octulosonate 8-phosphate phosphatase (KDO 8-P phosphatase)